MSLREKILNCKDIGEEIVHVREWDCDILVRGMTGTDRNKLLQNCISINTKTKETKTDLNEMILETVIECSYDPETKEKIFSKEDKDILGTKSGKALNDIFSVASNLSGLNEEIEEVEKNS